MSSAVAVDEVSVPRVVARVLVMEGVHKSLGAGVVGCGATVRVLAGVSLVVWAGEIVGVAGGAGAGKSMLLRCAAGVVRVERGRVGWAGEGARGCARGENERAGRPVYLDLRDRAQRHAVRDALAGEARLILLDHATPAVLEELRAGVMGAMERRWRAGIVVAGRSAAELARVASRVLELSEGRLRVVAPRGVEIDGGPLDGRGSRAQRKRSAARASSEFPSVLARARMRSTWGRSFRSPQ